MSATKGGSRPSRRYTSAASPEKKSVDIFVGNSVNNTGAWALMNGIDQGSAFWNRIGNRIFMKSLRILLQIQLDTPAAGVDWLRMIVVYDRQTNKLQPAVSDVLQCNNYAGGTYVATSISRQFLNVANSERFWILADEYFAVADGSNTALTGGMNSVNSSSKDCVIDRFIKLKGLETRYVDDGHHAIGDIGSGSLFLLIVGINTAARYSLQGFCRLKFYDA